MLWHNTSASNYTLEQKPENIFQTPHGTVAMEDIKLNQTILQGKTEIQKIEDMVDAKYKELQKEIEIAVENFMTADADELFSSPPPIF